MSNNPPRNTNDRALAAERDRDTALSRCARFEAALEELKRWAESDRMREHVISSSRSLMLKSRKLDWEAVLAIIDNALEVEEP